MTNIAEGGLSYISFDYRDSAEFGLARFGSLLVHSRPFEIGVTERMRRLLKEVDSTLQFFGIILAGASLYGILRTAYAFGFYSAIDLVIAWYSKLLHILLGWIEPLINALLVYLPFGLKLQNPLWHHFFILFSIFSIQALRFSVEIRRVAPEFFAQKTENITTWIPAYLGLCLFVGVLPVGATGSVKLFSLFAISLLLIFGGMQLLIGSNLAFIRQYLPEEFERREIRGAVRCLGSRLVSTVFAALILVLTSAGLSQFGL